VLKHVGKIDFLTCFNRFLVLGPEFIRGILGDQGVAMRQGDEVYYLNGDYLGSISLTTDQAGVIVSEARYLPYGQERWTSGATPTDFGFTGQRKDGYMELIDFGARWYDPQIGRFISADTIIWTFAKGKGRQLEKK
jgi:RHS repeat-associated protein